ncbi:MAG TPA: HEAT repeat domain-containing protein, partial [Gemmataceae bacterium]|nr:HEAT repeat domain-containing protein [Gemmataceae bacterium]
MRRTPWLPAAVALLLAVAGRAAPPAEETAADEKLLKEAKVATDGPGLLAFLRKRVPDDEGRQKVAALVRRLGSDDFPAREEATKALVAVGPPALPLLRQALNDPDAEVKRRARGCIEAIEKAHSP